MSPTLMARFALVLPARVLTVVSLLVGFARTGWAQPAADPLNLALVATASGSYVSGDTSLAALNDDFTPRNSRDATHGTYGNWNRTGTQWVQYEWSQPISTNRTEVYWWNDGQGIGFPRACRLLYWDGARFVPVAHPVGLGVAGNQFNVTSFDEVTTTRLRLEIDAGGATAGTGISTGIIEWRVLDSGRSPAFPPTVAAGVDRDVVLGGKTYLHGSVKAPGGGATGATLVWSQASGPGAVTFADAHAAVTTATFSAVGDYVLRLQAGSGALVAADTAKVHVAAPPPAAPLEQIATLPYQVSSPLLHDRIKTLITSWIPHCMAQISDLNLREGGIDNLIQAGRKLAGQPAARHVGYPFSNAWIFNTVESMSDALEVDPQGDPAMIAAQQSMRAKIDEWIPLILAAQEPDGYFQTRFTLNGGQHWDPRTRDQHEGYVAGYFLEAAIAHYQMTGKKDSRLYDAAKKLADCWDAHLGPAPKKAWYDGHEEMEQALVRFGRFVNDTEGPGQGTRYIALAKFLLDCRQGGASTYDQSLVPVVQQYEAVGHAVRATYLYAGMAAVAMETRDPDYQSAVLSLWDNLVNKKYYLTGGIGSGETSEGFGRNYSLPNNSYCESCSNCGVLFFQHKLNLTYQDAKFADLYEDTFYNAILGDYDLTGGYFNYTNPLDASGGDGALPGRGNARYAWHTCPCCVSNFPRTLLMLPTWMYAKSPDSICVNLFAGSTVSVGEVAGTDVQLVQTTDYPWSGSVALTVNPAAPRSFSVRIRVPNRNVSALYTALHLTRPARLVSLAVNGQPVVPVMDQGYAVVTRTWQAGDKVELVLPMEVTRVKADNRVAADAGRVALRYGPLIYNLESVDQNLDRVLAPGAALTTEWRPDLLGGVRVITGAFADGSPLTAIPNYARLNRGGRSIVWMRDQ